MAIKTIFLDRDGVINKEVNYLHKAEDFKFIHGVFEACNYLIELKYEIIIITNQSGISRGYYSEKDFFNITNWMLRQFKNNGVNILDVFHCPHSPNENCTCRKPKPGMILKASKELEIDLSKSILVGDSIRDINAGLSAEIKNNFLITHKVTPYSKKNIAAIKNKNNVFVCDNFDQIKIQANRR